MENHKPADQLDQPSNAGWGGSCTATPETHPALHLIAARPDIFVRQGYVAATYRRRNGKTFGPYYLLAYRDDGRQRSVYLGRAGALVERVREALAALQGPRVQCRLLTNMQRQIRAALRVEKLHLAALLRPFGLRLQGFEVRGWRISPLRPLLPLRCRRFSRPSIRVLSPYHCSREVTAHGGNRHSERSEESRGSSWCQRDSSLHSE
jgi:hypothetical protein